MAGKSINNKAWKKLLANSSGEISELRDKVKLVVDDIGLSVPEFREVIQTVQRGQRGGGKRNEVNLRLVISIAKNTQTEVFNF